MLLNPFANSAYLAEMAPKASRRLQVLKAMKAMKYPAFQGAKRLRRGVKEMKAGNYKVAFDSARTKSKFDAACDKFNI